MIGWQHLYRNVPHIFWLVAIYNRLMLLVIFIGKCYLAITLNQCYCIRRTLLYVLICISLNRVSIGKIAWYVTGRKSNVWKIERKCAVICEYEYSITRLLMPGLLAPTVHQQPSHDVGYARATNHFILRGVISNTCITSLLRNFRIYIYIYIYIY